MPSLFGSPGSSAQRTAYAVIAYVYAITQLMARGCCGELPVKSATISSPSTVSAILNSNGASVPSVRNP